MENSRLCGKYELAYSQILGDDFDTQGLKFNEEDLQKFRASAQRSYIGKMAKHKPKHQEKTQSVIRRRKIFPSKIRGYPSEIEESKIRGYPSEIEERERERGVDGEYLNFQVEEISDKHQGCCHSLSSKQLYKCEIANRKLTVKEMRNNQPVYFINFDTVHTEIIYPRKIESTQLILKMGDAKLKFKHNKLKAVQQLVKALKEVSDQSLGKLHNMNELPERKGFYKINFETERFFEENCDTGDVILFEDDHFFARVQRVITNSDYDHVAMIIKDPVYGTLLFESNSATGVCLTPWEFIVKYGWYKNIGRIVWRRLEAVERTKWFSNMIHEFVLATLHKNYYISFEKLLSNKSYIPRDKNDEGYFCSELVANVYKDLQLLTRNRDSPNYRPACNFYPKDFSSKANLKLEIGRLSPEIEVFFHPAVFADEN